MFRTPAAGSHARRPRRTRVLVAVTVAGALAAGGTLIATALDSSSAQAAPPDAYQIRGFDTSHHNHGPGEADPIDYKAALASGEQFAFMKATEGVSYTDPWVARDLKAASEAGIMHAPYHFWHPDAPGDGATQGQHFVDTAKAAGYTGGAGQLPPVLDLEPIGGNCPPHMDVAQVKATLDTMENAFKLKPIVYTSKPFVDQCMGGDASSLAGYPLWQPRYQSGSTEPDDLPGAGAPWMFWQHTSTGQVAGVPDDGVDRNVFRNSLEELQAMAGRGGGDAPAPEEPKPPQGQAKEFPTWGTRWVVHATADPDSKSVGMLNESSAGADKVRVDYQVDVGREVCQAEYCSRYMAHLTAPVEGFLSVTGIDIEESQLPGVPVRKN